MPKLVCRIQHIGTDDVHLRRDRSCTVNDTPMNLHSGTPFWLVKKSTSASTALRSAQAGEIDALALTRGLLERASVRGAR